MTRIILLCLLLCATPAHAHDLDLCHDGATVTLSTTTWALLSERDALRVEALTAAEEEIGHLEAELAVRRAITASVAAALRVGVDASRDLGACLAREADAESRALACESGRLGPVELAAGAGGAAVAGALVGVLACGVLR